MKAKWHVANMARGVWLPLKKIFADIQGFFKNDYRHQSQQNLRGVKNLQGKTAIITAGATREMIDPVRFISNHSSGQQGVAIAEILRDAGVQVTLIHGNIDMALPSGIDNICAESADKMLVAVQENLPADILIATAAVADWKIANYQPQKMKKSYS